MRRPIRWLAGLLATLVVSASVLWLNRDWMIAQVYIHTMEWEGRVESLSVGRVLEVMALAPGQRVADIGSGTGLFTRPFARAVGASGVAYAVDVNVDLLSHVEKTAREQQIDNIRVVRAAYDDPLIPEPVDWIFLCNTLHHIEDREAYVSTFGRFLKPSGRVAVIDFREDQSPHLGDNYTAEQLDSWMTDAGFELTGSFDFIADNFFVIYECLSCPGS